MDNLSRINFKVHYTGTLLYYDFTIIKLLSDICGVVNKVSSARVNSTEA